MATYNLLRVLDIRHGGTGAPSLFFTDGFWIFLSGPVDPFLTSIDDVPGQAIAIDDIIRHPTTNIILADPKIVFDPAVPGKYIFEYVQIVEGTETRTVLVFDIIDPLFISIDQPDTEVCLEGVTNYDLFLSTTAIHLDSGLPFANDVEYTWYINGKKMIGQTGPNLHTNLISNDPLNENTYVFKVEACSENCADASASFTIKLSPYIYAGEPVPGYLCAGEGAAFNLNTLVSGGSPGSFFTLPTGTQEWIDVDGVITGNAPGDPIPDPSSVDLSTALAGIYTFTRTVKYVFASLLECSDTVEVVLVVEDGGDPGTGGSLTVCNGCEERSFQICPDC